MSTIEAAEAAYHAGARTPEALAREVRVTRRHASRLLDRFDPSRIQVRAARKARLSADYCRVKNLAREGLPTAWIAEDVGLRRETVDRWRKRAGIPYAGDYRVAYMSIRRNPTLLELHREFAPKEGTTNEA